MNSVYIGLLRKTFLQRFMFRSELIFGIIGNLLAILISVSIWTSLFARGNVGNITLDDMITFAILSFVVRIFTRTRLAEVLGAKVKSGTIAMDLIRPVNLKWFLIANDIRVYPTII